MAILIALTTFERPTLLISKPSLLLPWTCDNYGLVLFSVVAECNVCSNSFLLLSSLKGKKKLVCVDLHEIGLPWWPVVKNPLASTGN